MSEKIVLVDAHVHIYPTFDPSLLLSSAYENFSHHCERCGIAAADWTGVLMLTETSRCQWFDEVCASGNTLLPGGWRIERTNDALSLSARGPQQQRLFVIAGRQVVTREGIEVLTLACRERIADGGTFEDIVQAGLDAHAIVVLPWGVGKWLGRRGALIDAAVKKFGSRIFAGDNGGRPWMWPRPPVFAVSESAGRPVLSGTDPLPLPGRERNVGRVGVQFAGTLDESAPGRHLRERLQQMRADAVQAFGPRESMIGFLRDQIGLRMS